MSIWADSIELTKEVYDLCKCFPETERYGLTSQLQRASVSIAANIAEGSGKGDVEFRKFLKIAVSSAYEVETLLIIAYKISYICDNKREEFIKKVHAIQKGIFKFMSQLDIPKQ